MRILMGSQIFLPQIGGVELTVHHLANALSRLGHEVLVFAPRYWRLSNRAGGNDYRLYRYLMLPKGLLLPQAIRLNLRVVMRFFKPDIVHVHQLYPIGAAVAELKECLQSFPLAVTVHAADIQKLPALNYGYRMNPRIDGECRLALRVADAVIAISPSIRSDVLALSNVVDKLYDIPIGTWVNRFEQPAPVDTRKMFGIRPDEKLILAVGRNHPKKRFDDLVRAVALLASDLPDVRSLIIGRDTDTLKPLIAELGVAERVILPGQFPPLGYDMSHIEGFPDPYLLSAYLSSNVFVLPSLIEGFAQVMVEAMAAGLPIVTTDVPGNRDAITHGREGLMVEPCNPHALASAIKRVLMDDQLRVDLGRNAKAKARAHHDWLTIARAHCGVYESLLIKRRG